MSDNAMKIKEKKRKKRYTFPAELDEYNSNNVKHKRRHSINHIVMENVFVDYNEKHFIIKNNVNGVKKEIIIKKYTKIHPLVENEDVIGKNIDDETNAENFIKTQNLWNILSKIVVKILCYIGIFSCAAI
jgi:hypothetical protein